MLKMFKRIRMVVGWDKRYGISPLDEKKSSDNRGVSQVSLKVKLRIEWCCDTMEHNFGTYPNGKLANFYLKEGRLALRSISSGDREGWIIVSHCPFCGKQVEYENP